MTPLVTLAEAKEFIRVISDHEDASIAMMIQAATETALAMADGWDQASAPPARLKLAVLAHVAQAYDDRVDVAAPEGNVRLLGPLRMLDV